MLYVTLNVHIHMKSTCIIFHNSLIFCSSGFVGCTSVKELGTYIRHGLCPAVNAECQIPGPASTVCFLVTYSMSRDVKAKYQIIENLRQDINIYSIF